MGNTRGAKKPTEHGIPSPIAHKERETLMLVFKFETLCKNSSQRNLQTRKLMLHTKFAEIMQQELNTCNNSYNHATTDKY